MPGSLVASYRTFPPAGPNNTSVNHRVLPMRHLSRVALRGWLSNDQLVPETLMMALDMNMRKVRLDHIIQRPLAQYEHLGECLLLKFGCKNFSVCL
jgi:hypothetical protein